MIALFATSVGVIAGLALIAIWAVTGVCPPPYNGPRTAPAPQPHVTRFRP